MRTPTSILGLLFFAVLLVSGVAGPLEDGTRAFEQNDWVPALMLLQPFAEQGNARAQFMVGAMYFRGWGVTEDLEAGLEWIRKAADQGFVEAQSDLGIAYLNGRGTKRDYAQAMKWFIKAADQGDSAAQRRSAKCMKKAWACRRAGIRRKSGTINHGGDLNCRVKWSKVWPPRPRSSFTPFNLGAAPIFLNGIFTATTFSGG